MESFTLPDYLVPYGKEDLLLYDYHAIKESSRQQVTLSKNTISFLQEGEKEIITDNARINIDDTKFLVMTAGNCLMTEKFSSIQARYNSLLFFFSDDSLLNFVSKHRINLSNTNHSESAIAFTYDNFILTYIQGLKELIELKPALRGKILTAKFEELMLYLVDRDGSQVIQTLMNHVDKRSFDLVRVVEANKHHKLSLKQLAFLCHMSVSTFKRAFENHYQESPIKWFQNKRLEYAAILLQNQQKRPSDIYLEIGYESLSNFIQAFKHKYGQTPKQYQLSTSH